MSAGFRRGKRSHREQFCGYTTRCWPSPGNVGGALERPQTLIQFSQAESVSHHLSVPVLRHRALKPAYSCIASIRRYFGSLGTPIKDEELVIVGDRIFTDVVMANRMHRYPARSSQEKGAEMERSGPLAVWTTGVWQRESMMIRWLEKGLIDMLTRWTDDGG